MVLDVVAIVTPAPGKEARVAEILKDLIAKVEKNEPTTLRYRAYTTQNADGATEYVFTERYEAEADLEKHMGTDYFAVAGKQFGDEGLLAKGLVIYKMQALAGFDSR